MLPEQYIVNVSTGAIHDFGRIEGLSSYSLTKTTGALLLQKLAGEKDPRQMQIINFHPGAVFTQQTKEKGMTERSLNWDDGKPRINPSLRTNPLTGSSQSSWRFCCLVRFVRGKVSAWTFCMGCLGCG